MEILKPLAVLAVVLGKLNNRFFVFPVEESTNASIIQREYEVML